MKNNAASNQKLEKCWVPPQLDRDSVNEYYGDLILFYSKELKPENYEQSMNSTSFFQFLISEEEGLMKNETIKGFLKRQLPQIIPNILINMKLTEEDIAYLDMKFPNETTSISSSSSNNSNINSGSSGSGGPSGSASEAASGSDTGSGASVGGSENEDETNNSDSNNRFSNYNPDMTLRKISSRLLDGLSFIFSQEIFSNLKGLLENDMQSSDDLIKERSILAFGAIGQGSYMQVIGHLKVLIPFLIRELRHPNKFVRAISCWTLSRYTKYILVDNYFENKDELFKKYLTEILTKFLDKDNIVRGSAGCAFQVMIKINKILIEPYLFDVLKMISRVFDKYTGSNLLFIYDILVLLMENFEGVFQNKNLVEDIIKCIVQKWYELVKGNETLTLPSFFDVIICLISVSGNYLLSYCEYFLAGCMKIIEQNVNLIRTNPEVQIEETEKGLLVKSIDVLSTLSINFPDYIKNSIVKSNIIDFLFEIMKCKDFYILHYATALYGDLLNADAKILGTKSDDLLNILVTFVEVGPGEGETLNEKMTTCNNAIWVIGLIGIYYPDEVYKYIETIMEKIKPILSLSKINKSLARNISICIGRLALVSPEKVSKCLEWFLKPFCISLRQVRDSPEKRDAYRGVCQSITYNPKGTFPSFIFFCDSLCLYEQPPEDMEKIFQDIIYSFGITYKEEFKKLINNFPPNLKAKMIKRFKVK